MEEWLAGTCLEVSARARVPQYPWQQCPADGPARVIRFSSSSILQTRVLPLNWKWASRRREASQLTEISDSRHRDIVPMAYPSWYRNAILTSSHHLDEVKPSWIVHGILKNVMGVVLVITIYTERVLVKSRISPIGMQKDRLNASKTVLPIFWRCRKC